MNTTVFIQENEICLCCILFSSLKIVLQILSHQIQSKNLSVNAPVFNFIEKN